jgi:protein MpaA
VPTSPRPAAGRITALAAAALALVPGAGRPAPAPAAGAPEAPPSWGAWPGVSVQGRPIAVVPRGRWDAAIRILVVGSIHGNEPAGLAVTRRLRGLPVPRRLRLWLVDELNPDGSAAGTRQNARGVDLNRNFPHRWRPAGPRWDGQYPGPQPLSEPEARAAARLILRVRPDITVWFHQQIGPALVDLSGGDARIQRRYARLAGLPVLRLPRYRGSATSWQHRRLPATTAFVVELAPGRLPADRADRLARAILRLAVPPATRSR